MKNAELIKGMFVKQGDVDWVAFKIDFNAEQLAELLIKNKEIFAANKGFGSISICKSKNDPNKFYTALSTFVPQRKTEVKMSDHMAERETSDLPF